MCKRKMINNWGKITCIYCFENIENHKKYIGQAENLRRRIKEHLSELRANKDDCIILQSSWTKYGEEKFIVWVVEEFSVDTLSKEEIANILNGREIYWIKELHSHYSEGGCNISWGGDAPMRGRNHSPETIAFYNDGHRKKGKGNGHKHSDETKKLLGDIQRGQKRGRPSDETIEKIRKTNTGKIHNITDKTRETWTKQRIGRKPKNSYSAYHGLVRRHLRNGDICWDIRVKIKGKVVYIGRRRDEIDAAKLFDAYIIEHNLPNPLNFPLDK
jgi:group I intron endonuclease